MFSLEQAIAEWRRQMAANGIKTPALLDELQNHLREDIERQLQSGADVQQAFETAVQRLGQASVLRAEFAKCGGLKEARSGKVIGIACCAFAGLFSLLVLPRLLTIQELSMTERIWGLAAIAVTMLSIVSFRFSYRWLPVIRERRLRMAVGVGCGLTGAVWLLVFGNLLPDVIVPHILGGANGAAAADSVRGAVIIGLRDIPPTGHEPVFLIGISILWAMALTAALGGIAYGIEEAARRRAMTAGS
jgi:hypothetical protein